MDGTDTGTVVTTLNQSQTFGFYGNTFQLLHCTVWYYGYQVLEP